MNDWDKILKDFAYKCGNGGPDMTNPRHLALLRESLLKFGWKENAMNEFLGNLRTLQVLREPLVEAKGTLKPPPPTEKTATGGGTPRNWYVKPDGTVIARVKSKLKLATVDDVKKHNEKKERDKKEKERDKKEKENQAKADAIHKGIYGKKKGMLDDTEPDSDGDTPGHKGDGYVKQVALDNGFVPAAWWNAPGGSASLFNEILSGEGADILDEWEKKHPGEEVPEEVLAEILMKQFDDTGSAEQQAATGTPFVTEDDIPKKYTKDITDKKEKLKDHITETLGENPKKPLKKSFNKDGASYQKALNKYQKSKKEYDKKLKEIETQPKEVIKPEEPDSKSGPERKEYDKQLKKYKEYEEKLRKYEEYRKFKSPVEKAEQDKATYSKALLTARSAKRKHKRGKRAVETVSGQTREDGSQKFGEVKKTHHFYGAKDSIKKQKEMIDRVSGEGKKIYAPDGTEISPEDLKWWIDAGGGGANPTDTAQFIEDEDGNLIIMFASDKTTTADIQDNSTLAQEIKDRKARIDEIDPKDMSSDDENQSGEEVKAEVLAEVDFHQGKIAEYDSKLQETTIPAADAMKGEKKKDLAEEWDDNPDTTGHWKKVRAAFRGGDSKRNYQKHLPGWPDGKGRPAGTPPPPNKGQSYDTEKGGVEATDEECVQTILNKVSKGEGSGTDAKIITRSAARIQKGGSDIPKNPKYDVQKQISAIRKQIVTRQRRHKNTLDKYKVNGVSLGNLLEAQQASSALHFGMLDTDEPKNKYKPPVQGETEEQKAARIKKGMMGHGMFEANMGGTVVNREILEECLKSDSVDDVEQNFRAVQPGKNDRYTRATPSENQKKEHQEEVKKWKTAHPGKKLPKRLEKPKGSITGRTVYIYMLGVPIAYKTYRPKSGKVGKTSNTMQYTTETQRCFEENQHLVTN
jgi:hypothetical protein